MALSYPESNVLTGRIIAGAIEVHRNLGPGLLESSYEQALFWELADNGMVAECQCALPLTYKTRAIEGAYRADMIVDATVLLEIKSMEKTLPVHKSQVLTYLRMSKLHVGLLLNFNVERMVDGITRLSL